LFSLQTLKIPENEPVSKSEVMRYRKDKEGIYDQASPEDGKRILVDRLWPRGIRKEEARIDEWLKDIAPSTELRKWFSHDPAKWEEFKKRYKKELEVKEDLVKALRNETRKGTVTLLFAAKDPLHANAEVLKEVLEKSPGKRPKSAI
jgi:uncharacterized protein YeaO (DUF488 family)